MDERSRIEQLIRELNEASEAYYGGRDEIMTNFEWDEKFDELAALEAETGILLPDSPPRKVSAAEVEVEGNGQKEAHEFPALSLAKTKKIEDLQKWAGDLPVWLSWKLDGLTLVLTYDNGMLTRILTRGNGVIGSNITYMKSVLRGFPQQVDIWLIQRAQSSSNKSEPAGMVENSICTNLEVCMWMLKSARKI